MPVAPGLIRRSAPLWSNCDKGPVELRRWANSTPLPRVIYWPCMNYTDHVAHRDRLCKRTGQPLAVRKNFGLWPYYRS